MTEVSVTGTDDDVMLKILFLLGLWSATEPLEIWITPVGTSTYFLNQEVPETELMWQIHAVWQQHLKKREKIASQNSKCILGWCWWRSSLGQKCSDCPKYLHEHEWEQGVSLFCVILVHYHVFRRRRVENALSDEAVEMGRHRHSLRFSASLKIILVPYFFFY